TRAFSHRETNSPAPVDNRSPAAFLPWRFRPPVSHKVPTFLCAWMQMRCEFHQGTRLVRSSPGWRRTGNAAIDFLLNRKSRYLHDRYRVDGQKIFPHPVKDPRPQIGRTDPPSLCAFPTGQTTPSTYRVPRRAGHAHLYPEDRAY